MRRAPASASEERCESDARDSLGMRLETPCASVGYPSVSELRGERCGAAAADRRGSSSERSPQRARPPAGRAAPECAAPGARSRAAPIYERGQRTPVNERRQRISAAPLGVVASCRLDQVPVQIRADGDRAVPEPTLHRREPAPGCQQHARVQVPQRVERDPLGQRVRRPACRRRGSSRGQGLRGSKFPHSS